MRHFDALIKTNLIYDNMESETKQNLRTAFDILTSDCTGLGYNSIPVSDIGDSNIRAAANNIKSNYENFMYIQDEIELMADFLDIPLDRVAFFKTTMNLIAKTNRHTTKVWK